MLKRLLLLTIVIALAAFIPLKAFGQLVPQSGIMLGNVQGSAVVVANGAIRVCTAPTSTTTPCNTQATIYPVLTNGTCGTNPISSGATDVNGNYSVCVAPGQYVFETSSAKFAVVRSVVNVSSKAVPEVSVNASTFSGSDCGTKVNAADISVVGVAAEITVSQACGTTWTTPITLTNGHSLRWAQGGTYVVAPANIALGNNLIDFGTATVQLAAQSGGMAGSTTATSPMWRLTDGTTVASNVTFQNGTVDGNYVGQTAPCDHFWTCVAFVDVKGTATSAPSFVKVKDMKFVNWKGRPVTIHGYNEAVPYPSDVSVTDSQFSTLGESAVASSGLVQNLTFSGNRVTNWSLLNTNVYAALSMTQNNTDPAKNIAITGNKFLNTTATEYAVELFQGFAGGFFQNVTIQGNTSDANGLAGGSGYSVAIVGGTIQGNTFLNGAARCGQRCGMELPVADTSVTGNTLTNGEIALIGTTLLQGQNNSVVANTITTSGADISAIIVAGGNGGVGLGPQQNTGVSNNVIDISGATGSCHGVFVGYYGGPSQTNNITISYNTVLSGSTCHGVRILNALTPQSSGIQIKGNNIYGAYDGVLAAQADTSTIDVTIAENHIIGTTNPITTALTAVGAVRQWLNVTSATQVLGIPSGDSNGNLIGNVLAPLGGANAPSISFSAHSGTGLHTNSNGDLFLDTGGIHQGQLTNVAVNTQAAMYWLGAGAATSSNNYGSVIHYLQGYCWNGSASVADYWTMVNVMGSGGSRMGSLQFSHVGGCGTPGVSNTYVQFNGATALGFTGQGGTGFYYVTGTPTATRTFTLPDKSGTIATLTDLQTTVTNCASNASPAACGSATAGRFVVAAGATTVTVNTTAVTAASEIQVSNDSSIGAALSVTCNTTLLTAPWQVTARTVGTSFTLTIAAAPITNPECFTYSILN